MRWMVVCVAVLGSVGTVSAQETARFRARVGSGKVTGTESFTIAATPSGREVTSTVTMKVGAAGATFAFKETLSPSWTPETYSVELAGALGAASVTGERKEGVFALAVNLPTGAPTRDIPLTPNLVLMDNMLAAPYQVLLNVTGGKPAALTVVVPLQLAAVPATLEDFGTEAGTLDGRPITAAKLLLKVASVATEISVDPAANRLLRVFVPAQDAELVREGFVPAGTATSKTVDRPAGVTERDVAFKTLDGSPYPAVLCLPSGTAPAPVVVLVQGSGPQDRDETIGPNKPFRDIAWGLAGRGVATLRFDKRTYAFPKSYTGSLESESIDDAVDAAAFSRTLQGVDGSQVYVLGHSLGGLAAMYVAQRAPVKGMILMAAPGRPMDQVIRDQVRTLNASLGDAKVAEILKLQDEIMGRVRAGTATATDLPGLSPDGLRDMIVRDPIAELRKSIVPMLVLKGGKDAQVFQADFDALAAVAAARPGSESRLFPDLTHIFTQTDGPPEVRAIFQPACVSSAVIDTIATWVRRSRPAPPKTDRNSDASMR